MTVDAFNGFGGVCSKAINYVVEEYAKKNIKLHGMKEPFLKLKG